MINYLIGRIVEITAKYIVVETNSIGYEIFVSNPYSYEIDKNINIYTYQKVAEDELSLYGFKTKEEKAMFLDLISVKGIGAKTALVILEVTTVTNIKQAIINKEIEYLMKFPKIGKKSAQQIILDLESKYKDGITGADNINLTTSIDLEALEALEALGYDKSKVKKVLIKVDPNLSSEEKIKEALKLLVKI